MTSRRLHFQRRATRQASDGRHAIGFGVRVGYWPCLSALYVQLAIWRWRFDVWFGGPSYLFPPGDGDR